MKKINELIGSYVSAFCDHFSTYADKENVLKIWNKEFEYIEQKDEYQINFMNACRSILNNSYNKRMPTPGDVKDIIRGIAQGDKPVKREKQPILKEDFRTIRDKAREILYAFIHAANYDEKKKLKRKYYASCMRMEEMTGHTASAAFLESFRGLMFNDSPRDLALKPRECKSMKQ